MLFLTKFFNLVICLKCLSEPIWQLTKSCYYVFIKLSLSYQKSCYNGLVDLYTFFLLLGEVSWLWCTFFIYLCLVSGFTSFKLTFVRPFLYLSLSFYYWFKPYQKFTITVFFFTSGDYICWENFVKNYFFLSIYPITDLFQQFSTICLCVSIRVCICVSICFYMCVSYIFIYICVYYQTYYDCTHIKKKMTTSRVLVNWKSLIKLENGKKRRFYPVVK